MFFFYNNKSSWLEALVLLCSENPLTTASHRDQLYHVLNFSFWHFSPSVQTKTPHVFLNCHSLCPFTSTSFSLTWMHQVFPRELKPLLFSPLYICQDKKKNDKLAQWWRWVGAKTWMIYTPILLLSEKYYIFSAIPIFNRLAHLHFLQFTIIIVGLYLFSIMIKTKQNNNNNW